MEMLPRHQNQKHLLPKVREQQIKYKHLKRMKIWDFVLFEWERDETALGIPAHCWQRGAGEGGDGDTVWVSDTWRNPYKANCRTLTPAGERIYSNFQICTYNKPFLQRSLQRSLSPVLPPCPPASQDDSRPGEMTWRGQWTSSKHDTKQKLKKHLHIGFPLNWLLFLEPRHHVKEPKKA